MGELQLWKTTAPPGPGSHFSAVFCFWISLCTHQSASATATPPVPAAAAAGGSGIYTLFLKCWFYSQIHWIGNSLIYLHITIGDLPSQNYANAIQFTLYWTHIAHKKGTLFQYLQQKLLVSSIQLLGTPCQYLLHDKRSSVRTRIFFKKKRIDTWCCV